MAMQGLKLGTVALWTLAVAGTAGAADLRRLRCLPGAARFQLDGLLHRRLCRWAWNERDAIFNRSWQTPRSEPFRAASSQEGSKVFISYNVGLDSSFIGGGTLGCNWQPVGSPFVLGIEGEAGYNEAQGFGFSIPCSVLLSSELCAGDA